MTAVSAPDRARGTALLGYVMESLLCGQAVSVVETFDSPWDLWRVCVRADATAGELGLDIWSQSRHCVTCRDTAARLTAHRPIGHPDLEGMRCGCPYAWARAMRAPGDPAPRWPPCALTVAVCKPGAPRGRIARELAVTHDILDRMPRTLTPADTRRMYPDAYGADFVANRDAYMTSAPSEVLILRRRPSTRVRPQRLKKAIRRRLGDDELRNHLHMPDNPPEALCDIAHLAGPSVLSNLYEEYERARAETRLAFYRAVLGARPAHADRGGLR